MRTGQVFKLHDDKLIQFQHCRFRGYVNKDSTPKNPFKDKNFEDAFLEFVERNTQRKEKQKERKRKRQEKLDLPKLRRLKKKRPVGIKRVNSLEVLRPQPVMVKEEEKSLEVVRPRPVRIKEEQESLEMLPPLGQLDLNARLVPQQVNNIIINRQQEVFNDKRALIDTFLENL